MQNGREGGEGQINVNRQRKMKCQKFWWKWGSHKNCDISGIIQYFSKPFWICIYGWMGYYFLLFFFLMPNIPKKAMETEGETLGFRGISRFSIVNISWTKWADLPRSIADRDRFGSIDQFLMIESERLIKVQNRDRDRKGIDQFVQRSQRHLWVDYATSSILRRSHSRQPVKSSTCSTTCSLHAC